VEEKLKQTTNSIAFLIGLAIAGLYYMSVYDTGESREAQIASITSEMSGLQAEIDKMNKTIVEAEKYKDIAKQLGAELDVVLTAIPEKYNSTELMKVLSAESKAVGLSILNLNPQGGTPGAGSFYVPVGVSVGFEGTFNQLMKFMSNLTKVNRIIVVKGLQMTVRGGGVNTASPILSFGATFEAYRYLPGPGV
jgi:Tfp pilus assembly protein PilO